jgi:hypothetical protein
MRKYGIKKFWRGHTECHFFAVAAHQLIEHRDWGFEARAFPDNRFDGARSVFDKRHKGPFNMREHFIEYFQGCGARRTAGFMKRPTTKRTRVRWWAR